jgi:hypothetical protein
LIPPANVDCNQRKDSNEASDQLFEWTARPLWQNEPVVYYLSSLIVGVEYHPKATHSDAPAMVMASVKPKAVNYAMFAKPFAIKDVTPAQNYSLSY